LSIRTSLLPEPRQKKPLRQKLRFCCLVGLFAAISCTKAVENPDKKRLLGQLEKAQTRLVEMDLEIKTVQGDPATALALAEDKELLQSRMARIREQLIKMGALAATSDKPASGGGHH
jgi:hypothetical protein